MPRQPTVTREEFGVLQNDTKHIKTGVGRIETSLNTLVKEVQTVAVEQGKQKTRLDAHDTEISTLRKTVTDFDFKRLAGGLVAVLTLLGVVAAALSQIL